MSRTARLGIPWLPRHAIERGNQRLRVVFGDERKTLFHEILRL